MLYCVTVVPDLHMHVENASHPHEVCDSLSKAHSVHCHSHSIGKSKDQANRAAQLRTEAATYQEVGAALGCEVKKYDLVRSL